MAYDKLAVGNKTRTLPNLLKETSTILSENGKTLDDIVHIGVRNGSKYVPKDKILEFLNAEYNSWYGGTVINVDLVVRLSDGDILDRWESEGMEGWRYIHLTPLPDAAILDSPIKAKSNEPAQIYS